MISIFAQVATVWLVFIRGADTLYPAEFIEKVEPTIISAFLDAGVLVNFERRVVYLNDFPAPEVGKHFSYHRKLGRLARKLKLLRRGRIVHFVVPHTPDGYMVGAANKTCFKKNRLGYGYATAQEYNIFGAPRLAHSALGAIHEMGHTMDAGHVPSASIMNTNVLHLFNQSGPLGWDSRSINQIQKCVNWRRR